MGVIALKWPNSPVNKLEPEFLSSLSEKVFRFFFVHEWGSFSCNTNLLTCSHVSITFFCTCFLQIWDPFILRSLHPTNSGFSSMPSCSLCYCSGCGTLYVDSPWHNQMSAWWWTFCRWPGVFPIQHPSHDGSELQEVSRQAAVDAVPLFKHYRSDSHLPQTFPTVVNEDPGFQLASFLFTVLPPGFLVI